jgi:hypothetical protein
MSAWRWVAAWRGFEATFVDQVERWRIVVSPTVKNFIKDLKSSS